MLRIGTKTNWFFYTIPGPFSTIDVQSIKFESVFQMHFPDVHTEGTFLKLLGINHTLYYLVYGIPRIGQEYT